ncbi:MAG: hypothetical protein GY851_08665 [bacterium]|nr:hypothetical protein [bacterium]
MADGCTRIGTVASVNPARREARVRVVSGRAHELDAPEWIWIVVEDRPLRCRVKTSRWVGEQLNVVLASGVPRDTVARLKGAPVVVPDDERKPRVPGQYAPDELLGLDVRAEDGHAMGTVTEVMVTPAHLVIEVGDPDGRTFMLPLIDQVVVECDIDRRSLVLGEIEPYVVRDED